MLELIGKKAALTYFSILNAALSLVAYYLWGRIFDVLPIYKILSIGLSIPPLTLIILSVASRKIWFVIMKLNKFFYPDINGFWEGEIQLGDNAESLPLKAHVRVDMFDMSMDFQSSTSDSITVSMALRTDRGQHYLDYIYRNESKHPDRPQYLGTAALRVETSNGQLSMRGQYFTVRKTNGTIRLSRISS